MKDQTFDQLRGLKQLGLDAVEIFNVAIQKMSNPKIKSKLEEYNQEHREHVETLGHLIKKLPKEKRKDISPKDSVASEACALLKSSQSDEHILKSLFQLEEVIHERYIDALKELGSKEVAKYLNHNLAREQWHLSYVREALAHPEFFQEEPGAAL